MVYRISDSDLYIIITAKVQSKHGIYGPVEFIVQSDDLIWINKQGLTAFILRNPRETTGKEVQLNIFKLVSSQDSKHEPAKVVRVLQSTL